MALILDFLACKLIYGSENGLYSPFEMCQFGKLKSLIACDKHIIRTLGLAVEMIDPADMGDADREDIGCGVLYGT